MVRPALVLLTWVSTGLVWANGLDDFHKGLAEQQRGNTALAVDFYTRALQSNELHRDERATVLNDRANAYASRRQFEQAIADDTESIRLKPDPVVYRNRALIYGRMRKLDEAVADFGHAIRLQPQNPFFYLGRGIVLGQKRQFESSVADLTEAIRLDPKSSDAYLARATGWSRWGKRDEALSDFNEGIRLSGGKSRAYFYRGLHYFLVGSFPEASSDFERAMTGESTYAYGPLWWYITQEKHGTVDQDAFHAYTAKLDTKNWPGPLVRYFLGTETPDAVRKAASQGDVWMSHDQQCEADFFIGEHLMNTGQKATGQALLRKVVESCPTSGDAIVAQAEIHRAPN